MRSTASSTWSVQFGSGLRATATPGLPGRAQAKGRSPGTIGSPLHNNIGLALRALGRVEDAASHYTRRIGLKPNFAEAYSNLGDVLKGKGKLDEAVVCPRG